MGWKKKTLIGVCILLLLYTLAGFLVIPMAAEAILPDKLSQQLNRPVEIENISLNPFTLTLAVNGLKIHEKSGEENFVAFDEFFINIQWSSLFKLSLVSKELRLTNPFVRIERRSENTFNFSDLIPEEKEAPEPESGTEEPPEPFRFSLSNIELIKGSFEFRDTPADKTHRFADISFRIPMLSNFEHHIDTYTDPLLAGTLNETLVEVDVSTKPFAESMETIVDISLRGVNLPYYYVYASDFLEFELTEGNLDITSTIDFKKTAEGQTDLEISGVADLTNLKLADRQADELLFIPALHLEMAPSHPLKRNIHLAALSLSEPAMTIVRSADGKLNLVALGPAAKNDVEGGPSGRTSESGASQAPAEAEAQDAADADQDPFIFKVDDLNLTSGTIHFTDFAAPGAIRPAQAEPVKMTAFPVNLRITDFSTQEEHRAKLDFTATIDADTALSLSGDFGVSPPALNAELKMDNVRLSRAQPYFPDAVKLVLTDGRFDLSGTARLNTNSDGGLSAEFNGNAGIKDFALVGGQAAEDFLAWRSLDFNGINIAWNPTRIGLDRLAMKGLQQTVVVQKDGGLNVNRVYVKDAAETKQHDQPSGAPDALPAADGENAEKPVPFPVSIGEITLEDITVSYTDYNIEPNYAARLTLSEGSITGLSSEAFEGAQLSLNGSVNDHAPVAISGKINPLLTDLLLDVEFDVQNMELSPFSAYSGKYIGKAVEKGKLNLTLDYVIENKTLEAENRLLLDQFTLGHSVESDTATNLPVGLAIALLKDRQGEINLNLPVAGRLDDPKFSLTGILLQSLKNIVTKAATSPFDLVSSIVAGGEDLKYIEFEAGSAALNAQAQEKLDSITTLLYERPALNLELTGYVDTEKDRLALTSDAIERKIRAAKWAQTSKKGDGDAAKIMEIELSEEEYQTFLRQVYKSEVLSDPAASGNAKPLSDKTLTADEMKMYIRKRIEIKDAELRLLAQNRVQAVKGYILKDERIAGKRLFIREGKALTPPEAQEHEASRVELGLK